MAFPVNRHIKSGSRATRSMKSNSQQHYCIRLNFIPLLHKLVKAEQRKTIILTLVSAKEEYCKLRKDPKFFQFYKISFNLWHNDAKWCVWVLPLPDSCGPPQWAGEIRMTLLNERISLIRKPLSDIIPLLKRVQPSKLFCNFFISNQAGCP